MTPDGSEYVEYEPAGPSRADWLVALEGVAAAALLVAGVLLAFGVAWALIAAGALLLADRLTS